jgi:hypothetical protein
MMNSDTPVVQPNNIPQTVSSGMGPPTNNQQVPASTPPTRQKLSKKKIALIILVVVIGAGLVASHFLLPNKAQKQSTFVDQYAKEQGLIQFRTDGDPGKGPDNTTPWYEIYYKTSKSTDSLKTSLEASLRGNGYTLNDSLFDPTPCMDPAGYMQSGGDGCPDTGGGLANNGSKPYWVINGSSSANTIRAEITDISYSDTSDTNNLYKNLLGQHPVPSGFNVLDITITSR